MNARVFEILPILNTVDLRSNQCIDESFEGPDGMNTLPKAVTEKCVFTEVDGLKFKKLLDIDCGNTFFKNNLIYGGNKTKPKQWPFLVGILQKFEKTFICGGSLISNKHVLTAAHCVETKKRGSKPSKKQAPNDIMTYLGRYSLSSTIENDSVIRNIAEIFIHPNWTTEHYKYDADLAILVLEQRVNFTDFIQPVCLTDDSRIAEYEDGYVVGWGRSPSKYTEDVPSQILIHSISDKNCLQDEWNLGQVFSNRSFCAGGRGSGPCKGDSGKCLKISFKRLNYCYSINRRRILC